MATRCYQDLSLFKMPEQFRGRSSFIVQLWWLVEQILFRPSPQFMYAWRRFLLRLFGAKIGSRVLIRPSVKITYPWNVEIADHVWIGDETVLYSLGSIRIGSHVAIAHRVYLCTGLHNYEELSFPIDARTIEICDEVWLSNDVFIAPGVSVGLGTVVGARSTVLKDLPSASICYGSPAKPIRKRKAVSEQIHNQATHQEVETA